MCWCIAEVHSLILFLGRWVDPLLIGLSPWPLLVSIVLCQTFKLAPVRSLRLLDSSWESLLLPWHPACTTPRYGQVLTGCEHFWADFVRCSEAPSIYLCRISAVGTSFLTALFLLQVPSLLHFGRMVWISTYKILWVLEIVCPWQGTRTTWLSISWGMGTL